MPGMSFETKGQELFAKVVAASTVVLAYVAAALVGMYVIHWFGPDLSRRCVCECAGEQAR